MASIGSWVQYINLDRFAAWVKGIDDGELVLLFDQGMAYQRDQSQRVPYDEAYFNKCSGYEGQEIAEKLNAGRIAMVERHYGVGTVADIGIGSGEFIRKRPNTYGVDINPVARQWLKDNDLWADDLRAFKAFTMFDVIEHCPDPTEYFGKMRDGSYLFASIPIFNDLTRIRESKHYRPGEHLYYWTEEGFVSWMRLHRFELLECSDFETKAGREDILSFAFIRCP